MEQLVKVLEPLHMATAALYEAKIVPVSLVCNNGLLTRHLGASSEQQQNRKLCAPLIAAALGPCYYQLRSLTGSAPLSTKHWRKRMRLRRKVKRLLRTRRERASTKKRVQYHSSLVKMKQQFLLEKKRPKVPQKPNPQPKCDPLEWWRKNAEHFPYISLHRGTSVYQPPLFHLSGFSLQLNIQNV